MTDGTGSMASLVLTRQAGGWRDRARSYILMVDGAEVAWVRHGERLEILLEPGHHKIFMRINWCRSQVIEAEAQSGEVIQLFCAPGGGHPLVSATVGRNSYIRLARI
jgi:hypothetical protein